MGYYQLSVYLLQLAKHLQQLQHSIKKEAYDAIISNT